MIFGDKIRALREERGLLLRQVAAYIEVDTAFISKVERGEKKASREQVCKLAIFLNVPQEELIPLWLSDKLIDTLSDDPFANEAIKITQKRIKNTINK